MLSQEQASLIVYYIGAVEECKGNHNLVKEKFAEDNYTEEEIDKALRALGEIAGQDCGIL
jgi:hypothetical protein